MSGCDLFSEQMPLVEDKTDDKTSTKEITPRVNLFGMFINNLMKTYRSVVLQIAQSSCWRSAGSRIFLDKGYGAKYPPELWLASLVVILSVALLVPLIVTGCVFIAVAATIPQAYSQGCQNAKAAWFHFVEVIGVIVFTVLLLAASLSSMVLLMNSFMGDLPDLVHTKRISGATLCAPGTFCICVGLYTAVLAIEFSCAVAVYNFVDKEIEEDFCGGEIQDDFRQDLLNRIGRINDHVKVKSEVPLFEQPHHLLSMNGWEPVKSEEVAAERLSATRMAQLGSNVCGCVFMVFCCVVQITIPVCWMAFKYDRTYLRDLDWKISLLICTGYPALFFTVLLVLSVSWVYERNWYETLVGQILVLLVYSPQGSRKFIHLVYKDNFLKDSKLMKDGKDVEDFHEALELWSYSQASIGPQVVNPLWEAKLDALKSLFKDSTKCPTGLTVESAGSPGGVKSVRVTPGLLDTEKFHALWVWMKAEDLIAKLRASLWLHIIVLDLAFALFGTMLNVFYYGSITSMVLANIFSIILMTYVIFSLTNLAIWHNRIRRDEADSMLDNWRDVIKKRQKDYLLGNLAKTVLDRLAIDSFFRGLLASLDQVVSRVVQIENPITLYGMAVSTQTLSQGALAIGSCVATALWRFLSESEDVKDALRAYTHNGNATIF